MLMSSKKHLLFVFDKNGDELSLFSDILFYQRLYPEARYSLLFVKERTHYLQYFLPSLAHQSYQDHCVLKTRIARLAEALSIASTDCHLTESARHAIAELRATDNIDGVYYLASFEASKRHYRYRLKRLWRAIKAAFPAYHPSHSSTLTHNV